MQPAPKPQRRATGAHPFYAAEPLERRLLLASISWINRGQASDGFAGCFGATAAAARTVVDAAITNWARLIDNFNYPVGTPATYQMTIAMAASGTSRGANAGWTTSASDGKPTSGSMTIGRGLDGPDADVDIDGDGIPDPVGDGLGYFIDPTPFESSEYGSFNPNAFATTAAGGVNADLFTVVLHEMGHAMGLASAPKTNALSTNTNQPDTLSSSPAIANYWRFDSGSTHTLWTGYDSGGQAGGASNANGAQHYAPAGASMVINGITYRGAADLMNPTYPVGARRFISQNDISTLSAAYGYTVKSADYYGTAYDYLDSAGTLRISTPGNGADNVTVGLSAGLLFVQMTLGQPVLGADPTLITSFFDPSSVLSIQISTGTGADTITVNGSLPAVTIDGGITLPGNPTEFDTLIVSGATGTIGVTSNSVTSSAHNITSIANIENLTINGTAANENFFVSSLPAHHIVTINAGNGTNNLFVGSGNVPNDIGTLDQALFFNGGTGADGVTFNNQNDTTLPGTFEVGGASSGFLANNGYTLFVSYSSVNSVTVNGSPLADTFDVFSSAPASITLNGFDGNDTFSIGGGNLLSSTSSITMNGGNGADTLVLDDSFSSSTAAWAVRSDAVYLGTSAFAYTGFEAITVLANGTNNDFQIYGSTFACPVTLRGGDGNDQFRFLFSSTAAFDVTCDGQAGTDTLLVDDRSTTQQFQTAFVTPTYIERTGTFTIDSYARYTNVESVTYDAIASATTTYVYGTSSQVNASQYTLFLGNNADNVVLYPHDAAGNLTINGPLGIFGNGGTDTFTVNDTAYAFPVNYLINNPSGSFTQNVYGMGLAAMGTAGVENITILAGGGDDSFVISQFLSALTLNLDGGAGNDSFDITPVSKNLSSNIANNNTINFTGGPGSDSLGIHNDLNPGIAINFTVNGSQLNALTGIGTPSFSLFMSHNAIENTSITGGPKADVFSVYATNPGTSYTLDGGPGAISDAFGVGYPLSPALLSPIHSPINLVGTSGGADTVSLYNTNDTAAHTFHIAGDSVGTYPGDNLFGAGGSVQLTGVTGLVTFNLGSGADTVYATPNATAPIKIIAANPTTFPGDTLYLPLATAINPLVTHSTSTSGFVTSDNLQRLDYTGFETGPTADAVAPTLLSLNFDPATSTFTATYSEPVRADQYALLLYDQVSGSYPVYGSTTATPDDATNTLNFTFPGGVLPAGLYSATVYGGSSVTDPVGNPVAGDAAYTFLFVPAAATLTLPAGLTFFTEGLFVDPAGTLDLTTASLVVDYSAYASGTLATPTSSPLDAVRTLLQSGYAAGAWTGTGIQSSTAAANPFYSIAYTEASTLGLTDFAGLPVDDTAVVLRYTIAGDANFDGFITGDDFALADRGYAMGLTGWVSGDFNYDAVIDDADIAIVETSLNAPPPPATATRLSVTPIPLPPTRPTDPSLPPPPTTTKTHPVHPAHPTPHPTPAPPVVPPRAAPTPTVTHLTTLFSTLPIDTKKTVH